MTNRTIMNNFEILQEVPKCDPKTRSEQMLLTPVDFLNTEFPQTSNLQKKTVSAKYIKMKHNKMKYSCVPILQMMTVRHRNLEGKLNKH